MSFLPGSLTLALLRSCHRKVISHSDGHSVVGCRKTKRADYTEHQKSAGAWLSLQSDVLCNRLWKFKVGFCFVQLPPTEPKAWWSSSALPVHRYRVGWTDLLCLNMVEHLYSVVRNSRPVTSILYRRCSVSSRLSNGSINLKKYFSLIRNFKRQNLQTQK